MLKEYEHIFVPVYQKCVTTYNHLKSTIQRFNHAVLTCWVSKINTSTMKQKDNSAMFLSIIMTATVFFYLQLDLTSAASQLLHKRAADRFARWTRLTLLAHLEVFLSILFQFQGYSGAALLTPDRLIENDSKISVMQFFLTLSCGRLTYKQPVD